MRLPPGAISIAFLDLLSGALAGVIILFIIVPKGTSYASGDVAEQHVSIDSLFVVIDSLYLGQDTLSRVDLELLRSHLTQLRLRVDSAQQTTLAFQREVVRRKSLQVLLEDSLRVMRKRTGSADSDRSESQPTARVPTPRPAPRSLPTRDSREASRGRTAATSERTATNNGPRATTRSAPDSSRASAQSATKEATAQRAPTRDPMPEMLDPFMVDVRWSGEEDVDLILLNRAGVLVCNDSRCNKRYAAMERSGKRDTAQYERMRVTTRQAETYDVRLAIHTRFGGGRNGETLAVAGSYYLKPDPRGPARKQTFVQEVAPRQRGDNGAPGVSIGTLTITDDGDVVFTPSS